MSERTVYTTAIEGRLVYAAAGLRTPIEERLDLIGGGLGVDMASRTVGLFLAHEDLPDEPALEDWWAATLHLDGDDYATRRRQMVCVMSGLLDVLRPSVVAVESNYVGRNGRVAVQLAMNVGWMVGWAIEHDTPVIEVSPKQAKQAMGSGGLSKDGVRWAACAWLMPAELSGGKYGGLDSHMADALAVWLYGLRYARYL